MLDTLQAEPTVRDVGIELDNHLHVPTPGDHYSPTTGSAIPTIIYEVARCHEAMGGRTRVIVGEDTRRERYPVGECVEVPYRPRRHQRRDKVIDTLCGRVGLPRRLGASLYTPVLKAVPRGFPGVLFIHNNPAAIRMFRSYYPEALLCLWVNNDLFRLYSDRELAVTVAATDRMICCSAFIANKIKSRIPAALHQRVGVVRNGVDPARFCPGTPAATGLQRSDPVILFIGRVVPIKGVDLLVKAATLLKEKGYRFKLRIVGSSQFSAEEEITPYERELRTMAARLGDAVEFYPFADRSQVIEQYRSGAIFCVPSNWDEPCGMVVGEGMACGLPVVVSRRGGIPELGGDAVLYFDPPDIGQLAAHLAALLDDPAVRKEWGAQARERAAKICWQEQYQSLCRILADDSVR